MEKINISFIQYGGLAYGGAQKQAVTLAELLNKERFSVRYFWCRHKKDLYSDFRYPEYNPEYQAQLRAAGVEAVEFSAGSRDISHPYHPWLDTNFFEVFSKYPTDIILGARAGTSEFPFVHLNLPLVEWNIFGSADLSENLVFSVAVSPWAQKMYLANGGRKEISAVCYPGIQKEISRENLRQAYNIGPEEVVMGFHQRDDDKIFAEHALRAFAWVGKQTHKKLHFFILGGSDKYKALAEQLEVKVNFLPVTFDYHQVSKFLNTLDIWTHSAGLGEAHGTAVQEAMMHGLPVVSIKGVNNGHLDVIGNTIKVADKFEQYCQTLLKLIDNDDYRKTVGEASKKRAQENFSLTGVKIYFENLLPEIYQKYCLPKKDFKALNKNIYAQFSPYRTTYRLLYKFPPLMSAALKLRRAMQEFKVK